MLLHILLLLFTHPIRSGVTVLAVVTALLAYGCWPVREEA